MIKIINLQGNLTDISVKIASLLPPWEDDPRVFGVTHSMISIRLRPVSTVELRPVLLLSNSNLIGCFGLMHNAYCQK